MKKLCRIAAILAGTVGVLAIIFVLLLRQPVEQQEQGTVFLAAEPVDVASVSVRNQSGSYRFYYEEDGYILDDIPGEIADLDAFVAFMTGCVNLSAVRRVSEDAAQPLYGVAKPAARVEIQLFDGGVVTLAIGSQEPISGQYYATVEGWDGVYLLAKGVAEPFLLPKTHIISKVVTPQLQMTSPLSAIRNITFTGGNLTEPVTLQSTAMGDPDVTLAALSFGAPTHIVQGAGVYQLDQTYGTEMLSSLFGIQAVELMGYNLAEKEVAQYGFAEPWMTVEYEMINGPQTELEHVVLQLAEDGAGRFYAMREGTGVVYRIERQLFCNLQYDKLLLRWLLTPLLMDLASVQVESPQGRYEFTIDSTDLRNPIIKNGEQTVDTDLFRSLFRLLTSAAHDGAYLGALEQPGGEPVLTIIYTYTNPDKEPDVMSLYPGEVRRANVFLNGVGEFAMKDQFVQRVEQGCADLLAGKVIEENW